MLCSRFLTATKEATKSHYNAHSLYDIIIMRRKCREPHHEHVTVCRFCEEYAKFEPQVYENSDRNPETKRRYGRAWKRIRDSYAAAHPLCELCLKEGRYVKTEEIHHIKPLSEGGTHARENLIALCKPCHARIHAQHGDRWHNR